jgi:hypothetical protein
VPLLCLLQGQLPPDLSAHLKALNSNCDLRGGVLPALVRALAGCSCGGEGGLQFTAERLAAANAHAAAQGYSSSAAGDSAVAAGPGAYRCWEEDAREAAKRLLRHFTAVRQHLQRHAVVTLDHKVAVAEAWLARVPHDCDLRPCGVCGIRDERHANRARMEVWEVPGHYTDPETELPGMELLLLDGDLAQAFAPGGRLAGSVELRTAAGEARQVSLKELYNIHTTPVGPAGTEDSPVDAPPAPGLTPPEPAPAPPAPGMRPPPPATARSAGQTQPSSPPAPASESRGAAAWFAIAWAPAACAAAACGAATSWMARAAADRHVDLEGRRRRRASEGARQYKMRL